MPRVRRLLWSSPLATVLETPRVKFCLTLPFKTLPHGDMLQEEYLACRISRPSLLDMSRTVVLRAQDLEGCQNAFNRTA